MNYFRNFLHFHLICFGDISLQIYIVLEITCIWIRTDSVSLQRCNFKHFLLREFKVEDIEVFLDSAWSNRLHQWQHACLHHPADNYLSHALAMVRSNRLQERMVQDIASSQWAPCFHKNIVLLAELHALLLGESRMILYLVNHRTDVCLRHYWLCMMLHEVGKTDAANQALFMQTLHRFPSIYIKLICILAKLQLVGWPVNEIEVEIIKP